MPKAFGGVPRYRRGLDVAFVEDESCAELMPLLSECGTRGLLRQSGPMRETISTPDAPTSPLYSQGIKAGGLVFVSGLVGIDVATGRVAGPSIQEQVRQAIKNCEAVLLAGGASLADVVEVGVLLHDPDDFGGMNEEWAAWFPTDPPTRYVAKLGAVLPGILVSVRMTASLT